MNELMKLRQLAQQTDNQEAISLYNKVDKEIKRLNNIINDLLKFISDMFDEEVINNSFDMTTKEFIEYIKSKLKGSDKE